MARIFRNKKIKKIIFPLAQDVIIWYTIGVDQIKELVEMLDRLDRVVRVGDVISMSWYDHGTTFRVIDIGDKVIYVKKCYFGKKVFPICFPDFRCDFTIVNR